MRITPRSSGGQWWPGIHALGFGHALRPSISAQSTQDPGRIVTAFLSSEDTK